LAVSVGFAGSIQGLDLDAEGDAVRDVGRRNHDILLENPAAVDHANGQVEALALKSRQIERNGARRRKKEYVPQDVIEDHAPPKVRPAGGRSRRYGIEPFEDGVEGARVLERHIGGLLLRQGVQRLRGIVVPEGLAALKCALAIPRILTPAVLDDRRWRAPGGRIEGNLAPEHAVVRPREADARELGCDHLARLVVPRLERNRIRAHEDGVDGIRVELHQIFRKVRCRETLHPKDVA